MRRQLVHEGASRLSYEIREIITAAKSFDMPVVWENIGDPIQKGEPFPQWMKNIVAELVLSDAAYAYSDTQGLHTAREHCAQITNSRGGCRITPSDILFFNGLGDAVTTLFGSLRREARILGPSPAYSTHSSAEAAHSGYDHCTYMLHPESNWQIDLDDIERKVQYNDAIAGILVINPDNPTGVVYSCETLTGIVEIARRHRLFLIFDETYGNIVFNGGKQCFLSEIIGDVPGISMRSISKEYPWPGGRCGWIEVYNRNSSSSFSAYIESLHAAKRLEVCSTTLPQLTIPAIMGDSRYAGHLKERADMFGRRAHELYNMMKGIEGISVTLPQGAFYFTVLFRDGVLDSRQHLPVETEARQNKIAEMTRTVAPDKRFVYYLLAHTGICVVPLSGFCTDRQGFRMTLLEHDTRRRQDIYAQIAAALKCYLDS